MRPYTTSVSYTSHWTHHFSRAHCSCFSQLSSPAGRESIFCAPRVRHVHSARLGLHFLFAHRHVGSLVQMGLMGFIIVSRQRTEFATAWYHRRHVLSHAHLLCLLNTQQHTQLQNLLHPVELNNMVHALRTEADKTRAAKQANTQNAYMCARILPRRRPLTPYTRARKCASEPIESNSASRKRNGFFSLVAVITPHGPQN